MVALELPEQGQDLIVGQQRRALIEDLPGGSEGQDPSGRKLHGPPYVAQHSPDSIQRPRNTERDRRRRQDVSDFCGRRGRGSSHCGRSQDIPAFYPATTIGHGEQSLFLPIDASSARPLALQTTAKICIDQVIARAHERQAVCSHRVQVNPLSVPQASGLTPHSEAHFARHIQDTGCPSGT